jgi:hypothetical protein
VPSRALLAAAGLVVAALVAGCGGDGDDDLGDQRADQARRAALDAGLDEEVADFLGLLSRGDTATYTVRYPAADGTELVVRNRPPDRRVDVEVDGEVVEVRQVVGGEAFSCTPTDDDWSCTRTDALADPPGLFSSGALARLSDALAERLEDYTFDVEPREVAGSDARCLVTRLRPGREAAELGYDGTICASSEGVVVLVDQAGERVEALDYDSEVDADAFERVDRAGGS